MSKKHNGLLWRVLKIWGTCLVIAFCVLGAIAIKRVGVPVVTMYKEASRDVSKSSKDTFKAEQTSIVYDADGNEMVANEDFDIYFTAKAGTEDVSGVFEPFSGIVTFPKGEKQIQVDFPVKKSGLTGAWL